MMVLGQMRLVAAVALMVLAAGRGAPEAPADGAPALSAAAASTSSQPAAGQAEKMPLRRKDTPASRGGEDRRLNKSSGSGKWWPWVQSLLALALVVALIFALRYVLRRLGGGGGLAGRTKVIDVVARTNLAPKYQLFLIRLGQRLILVGAGPEGLASLAEVTDPQEVSSLVEAAAPSPAVGAGSDRSSKERRR